MIRRQQKVLVTLLCAVVLVAGFAPASFAKSRRHSHTRAVPKPTTKGSPADEPGSILPKSSLFSSALLFNAEDGSILFARNIQAELPPASLAKLMLALIVVEDLRAGRASLTQPIRVSAAASMTPGSRVYLRKDEIFTLDEMMSAVLVHSANNASVAVAQALYGSEAAFVERMNAWARALGMRQTIYRSVNGLPQPAGEPPDVTTAFDMAILARRIVQYPEVLRWTSQKTAYFRNGKVQIRSTNRLLSRISGLDGLKTGFTLSAGFHLIATGERDGVRIVSVVLGSDTSMRRFLASEKLVRLGFASLGRSMPGENLPPALPDPETVAILATQTARVPEAKPMLVLGSTTLQPLPETLGSLPLSSQQ